MGYLGNFFEVYRVDRCILVGHLKNFLYKVLLLYMEIEVIAYL
jgi:hypothetical protein